MSHFPCISIHEQIKTNELISEYEHPVLGKIRQPRPGARFSRSDVRQQAIAPMLGEHGAEILTDMGMSDDDVQALVDAGVLIPAKKD